MVLEEDSEVIRFIKPPLNQLGLFYKAAKQYNPDFLVETADKKYMIEVKAANQTDNEDVQEKQRLQLSGANAHHRWMRTKNLGVPPSAR